MFLLVRGIGLVVRNVKFFPALWFHKIIMGPNKKNRYLTLNIMMTLKCGLEVTQDH